MPQVPVYDTPTVAPQGLPGVMQQVPYHLGTYAAQAGLEESQMGRGLLAAGGELAREAVDQQIAQNEAAAKDADTRLQAGHNGILLDPDTGYLAMKGKTAVDAYDATVKAVSDLPADIGKDLANPAQKQMFLQAAAARSQAVLARVAEHRNQQADVYAKTSGQLRLKTAQDGAALAYNPLADEAGPTYDYDDPAGNSMYQQSLETIRTEATELAARSGITEPQDVAAVVRGELAKAYMGTLVHLVDRKGGNAADLAVAKNYFDAIKDQLPAADQDKVRAVLNASSEQDNIVTVQRALQNMSGSFTDKRTQLGDAFDSQGTIAGVKVDGKIYERVSAALDHLESKAKADQDQSLASTIGQAQDFILKNPGATVADLPRSLYLPLMAKGQLAAIDAFANRETNKPTDPAILHNLYAHVGDGSAQDITKLTDADWLTMRGSMSRADWTAWDKQRTDILQGNVASKDDPGNLNLRGFNATLNNRMQSLGINPAPPKTDKDGQERVGAIQDFAAKYIVGEQQAAGRRFNQEETQKAIDRLFATNVEFRTSYLGGLVTTAGDPTRMLSLRVSDLPPAAVEGIKSALAAEGNPNPTSRDILMRYWSIHTNGRR